MELDQTEFEQFLVEADRQVIAYIEKERRFFDIEQSPPWRWKPKVFPSYSRDVIREDKYVTYDFFCDLGSGAELVIKVIPARAPYILCRLKSDAPSSVFSAYHDASLPLVPGLLAVMVKYFLDAGYTPLVDTKEK